VAFEAILSQQQAAPKRGRRIMLSVSLVVHAGALVVGVAHSLWQVDELPMPSVQVSLVSAAPPPPPPPPPPKKSGGEVKPKKKPIEPKPNVIVQPKDKPEPEPEPEKETEGETSDEEGGQEGGEVGGVAGGVVGGVVGSAPPPPPPKDSGPKLVSAQVARGQLLIDPNADQYRVKLPAMLARNAEAYFAVLRVCVSAQGQVTAVQLLKSASAAVDPQFPTVLGRWRYRPLSIDGKPTAFCYNLRYNFAG
jgi:periplasmic protein TonB